MRARVPMKFIPIVFAVLGATSACDEPADSVSALDVVGSDDVPVNPDTAIPADVDVPDDANDVSCVAADCAPAPANSCVDASTLRVWSGEASCADDACTYPYEDVTCTGGCADGACTGEPCGDLTCDTPPPSVCVEVFARRVYDATGVCGAGDVCAYGWKDEPCVFGCSDGLCQADACADVACDAPPAPVCVDDTTLRLADGAGRCDDGECSYATIDVACINGCASGACVPWAATQVVTGTAHACAVVAEGRVVCWGDNRRGQAGEAASGGHVQGSAPPRRPGYVGGEDFKGVTYLAAGEAHTCAVRDEAVYCWGDNSALQLGRETALDFDPEPAPVPNQIGFTNHLFARRVAVGRAHSCAEGRVENGAGSIQFSSRVVCWGDDTRGQVGQYEASLTPRSPMFVERSEGTGFLEEVGMLFSGDDHTCAFGDRESTGLTYYFLSCWGASNAGQSGDRTERPFKARIVTETTAVGRMRVLSAKGQSTCYTQRSGAPTRTEVVCFGDIPANGGLATSTPTLVAPWQDVADLAVGPGALCVIRDDGSVECLGSPENGLDLSNPTAIEGFEGVARWLAAGDGFACAIDGADSSVRCWGDNTFGQLGRSGESARTHASRVGP